MISSLNEVHFKRNSYLGVLRKRWINFFFLFILRGKRPLKAKIYNHISLNQYKVAYEPHSFITCTLYKLRWFKNKVFMLHQRMWLCYTTLIQNNQKRNATWGLLYKKTTLLQKLLKRVSAPSPSNAAYLLAHKNIGVIAGINHR